MSNKFSIIIPAYNEEKSIVMTLKSVCDSIKSSIDDFEVIVVDSNSIDNTGIAASEFLEEHNIKHRIVRADIQTYPGAARNLGIKNAAYDNLILVDCGVTVSKSFIDECVEKIGDYDFIWFKSGFEFKNKLEPAYVRPYFVKKENGRYLRHCAVKKSSIESLGYFREDLRAAEDWLFYKKVSETGCREYFSLTEAVYYGYPGSIREFYKKWSTYFEHSVYAGLHIRNIRNSTVQSLFVVGLFIILQLFFRQWFLSAVCTAIIFAVLRAGYSFYISKIKPKGFFDILYTIVTSTVLEISRIFGVIRGLIKK